ncbi:MAG TPA: hypothetical protein VJL58_06120, partial [Pyrinomonadaceae bacterium]|nr:hypothetical protein [Pyrinomonadaceae bacterium]
LSDEPSSLKPPQQAAFSRYPATRFTRELPTQNHAEFLLHAAKACSYCVSIYLIRRGVVCRAADILLPC